MHSNYVKGPKIKAILEENVDCENKIAKISALLDGKAERGLKLVEPSVNGVKNESEGESVDTYGVGEGGEKNVVQEATYENKEGYDSVVSELSGNDKKNAIEVLDLISKNRSIDWDRSTYELIVGEEKINFSDIRLLIKKTVLTLPISQPIGLTLFIDKLIDLKTPLNYFRSGDAREVRSQLLRIKNWKSTESDAEIKIDENVVDEGNVDRSEKRKRDESLESEDKEEEISGKRQKLEDTEEVKDTFNLQPEVLNKLRRSARLKGDIVDTWKKTESKIGKNGRRKKK